MKLRRLCLLGALLCLLAAAPDATAECLPIVLTSTTATVGSDPAIEAPNPAEWHQPIAAIDSAVRRVIALPCFTLQIDDAVPLGRVIATLHTIRGVWPVPARIRVDERAVPLHFTTFKPTPPDHPDHEGGCRRARAQVTTEAIRLFREDRADHYFVETARHLPVISKNNALLKMMKTAMKAAPRSSAPVARWEPPPPVPDHVVRHGAKAADAIRVWAREGEPNALHCESAAVHGDPALRWARFRSSVEGLAQAGFAPEVLGR